jgi:hypothetical protein
MPGMDKTQEWLDYLNALLRYPEMPGVLNSLIDKRVLVSEELADSSTPIVVVDAEDGSPYFGALGLINGFLDYEGQPRIMAHIDAATGTVLHFSVAVLSEEGP